MQLSLFTPETTFLAGYYTGDPVPQQEELLDVLEPYPYPVFSRVGLGFNHRVIVKVIGYSKKSFAPGSRQIVYCKTPEGLIGEFCPFEMFSDVQVQEVARAWGKVYAENWANLISNKQTIKT